MSKHDESLDEYMDNFELDGTPKRKLKERLVAMLQILTEVAEKSDSDEMHRAMYRANIDLANRYFPHKLYLVKSENNK